MAINKIEIQNSKGDVYYPHTSADVVKYGTNSTVKAELDKLPATYLRAIQYQAGNNGYLKLSNTGQKALLMVVLMKLPNLRLASLRDYLKLSIVLL